MSATAASETSASRRMRPMRAIAHGGASASSSERRLRLQQPARVARQRWAPRARARRARRCSPYPDASGEPYRAAFSASNSATPGVIAARTQVPPEGGNYRVSALTTQECGALSSAFRRKSERQQGDCDQREIRPDQDGHARSQRRRDRARGVIAPAGAHQRRQPRAAAGTSVIGWTDW